MKEALTSNIDDDLKNAFSSWIENWLDGEGSKKATDLILNAVKGKDLSNNIIVQEILKRKDQLIKKSIWSFGGDGWAYDIGYGGLDHVIATGEDINLLVMDTEVYSNTGGQCSKSTPAATVPVATNALNKPADISSSSNNLHINNCPAWCAPTPAVTSALY